jgi:hypothetical protein
MLSCAGETTLQKTPGCYYRRTPNFMQTVPVFMEDKEYLVLKFLSRFDAPIPFNDLETGLKSHFDKTQKDNLLFYVSNLEYKGWLNDNYVKGIQITEKGKKQLLNGTATHEADEEETSSRRKKKRSNQDYDQKASSFVYRTYWLMFAISIVAFVLALLSFLFWFFPGLRHTLFPG